MKIAITGSTGLIGQALTQSLTLRGDHVSTLHRGRDWRWQHEEKATTDNAQPDAWVRPESISGNDVVIHLAGEKISEGRWNDTKKKAIVDSRTKGTAAFANAIASLPDAARPHTFICASAIGYYGSRGDEILPETAHCGQGFLAQTCKLWEEATLPAKVAGVRVINIRLGLVLAKQGGALAKMLPVFNLGGGGVLGQGNQYWSWITLDDVTNACHFLLDRTDLQGPVNLVAPQPVTNRRFTQILGRTLRRPTFIPVPVIALRLAMGEMVDELLLASARVQPAVLQDAGYKFEHPQLEEALPSLLK